MAADKGSRIERSASDFDRIYSVNCAQFWPDLGAGLREIARVARSGARVVVAVQPRQRGATEADSERWAERLTDAARATELRLVEVARGATRPSTVAAVFEKP